MFPSVLVCNLDLFFLNRFMNFEQRGILLLPLLYNTLYYLSCVYNCYIYNTRFFTKQQQHVYELKFNH